MIFRKIKEKDILQIQTLALKSWLFTYNKIYSEDKIKQEVKKYYSDDKLKLEIKETEKDNELFLVAEDNKEILGYAHISEDKDGWELQRIYVNPDKLRLGIGKQLINHIEVFLRSKNIRKYIAHPHVDNPIAVSFYLKRGFKRYPEGDRDADSPCFLKEI